MECFGVKRSIFGVNPNKFLYFIKKWIIFFNSNPFLQKLCKLQLWGTEPKKVARLLKYIIYDIRNNKKRKRAFMFV